MKIEAQDVNAYVWSINNRTESPIIAVHWSHEGYQIHDYDTGNAICPRGTMEEIYGQLVAMRYGMTALARQWVPSVKQERGQNE
jgi:hypothetical protein